MSWNGIEFHLETALIGYLEEYLETKIPIRRKRCIEDVEYPMHFVGDSVAVEDPPGTGTYEVTLEIGTASDVSNAADKHPDYVGELMDLIFNDDLIDKLNADRVKHLVVQRVQKLHRTTSAEEGVCYTVQTVQIMCSMSG